MKKKGIAVAGNMIVDKLYPVHGLPLAGELTTILSAATDSTGGALCNVAMDLTALDTELPVIALGRVGTDSAGDFVLQKLAQYPNIDCSRVIREGNTSFTLVMADEITKQRSFFQFRGANADFCEDDIDWDTLNAEMLHIGYILLLDALDQADAEFGTKMARLLHDAQERGIKTSIDVVSEAGERFVRLVRPALRFTDYCVINELEAAATTGIALRSESGALLRENMPFALARLKEFGVSTWAVIHCPEAGFGLDEKNNYVEIPSLRLPDGYIKGSVGAGDAFCSGVLYAAWKGLALADAIELGTASAACSLSESGATEGMRSAGEAMALYQKLR